MNTIGDIPVFPFSALLAQERLQLALLLAAIDPGLGGVLISGPRGTAKSTSARALADLLPEGAFVTLPLGASETQLIGSLDLESVLRDGSVKFSPGLLAKAHLGVLYVDEVNLLADSLVDPLLDVAASGVNLVEREGLSHRHPARFVLIGTMNPEEGDLRPQLSDRFGLAVALENCREPLLRQDIVKTRLAFDLDPDAFCQRYEKQQADLAASLVASRQRLAALTFNDSVHADVSARCIAAGVDGLRADLVMLKAARALAAFEQAEAIDVDHVRRVAELVLLHRRGEGDAASHATGTSTQTKAKPMPPSAAQARQPHHPPQGTDGAEGAGNHHESQDEGAAERSGKRAENPAQHQRAHAGLQDGQTGISGVASALERSPAAGDAEEQEATQGDWGYLAPEPTPTVHAKRLRPFIAKKA